MLLDLKNAAAGVFDTTLYDTGYENANDPTANTYCNIGEFTDDPSLRVSYADRDGKYTFKLVFRYPRTSLVGYGTSSIVNVYNNSYSENEWDSVSTSMQMGNGIYYTNFLGIHPLAGAETYVEWNINAEYDRFTAIIGQPQIQTCQACQCAFIIYVDGTQIYSSGGMAPGDYQYVDVDISGGNVLRIETDEYDDGQDWDWAIVANPY